MLKQFLSDLSVMSRNIRKEVSSIDYKQMYDYIRNETPSIESKLNSALLVTTIVSFIYAIILSDLYASLYFAIKVPSFLNYLSYLSLAHYFESFMDLFSNTAISSLFTIPTQVVYNTILHFYYMMMFIVTFLAYIAVVFFHIFEHGYNFDIHNTLLVEYMNSYRSYLFYAIDSFSQSYFYRHTDISKYSHFIFLYSYIMSLFGFVFSIVITLVYFFYAAMVLILKFLILIPTYLIFKPIGFLFYYFSNIRFDIYETIYHIYGFSEPASERMYSVIEMYHNTAIILSYIFVVIFIIIGITIKLFRADVNKTSIPFDKRVEYLLDALFVLAPIIIVYYLTVPAISFILHGDRFVNFTDTLFSIEVVGHQWYWSYFVSAINSNYLFDLIYIVADQNFIEHANSNTITLEFDQMIDNEADFLTRCFEVNKHLVLPVHECIRCFVTSEDVIHSWALPQLGIKMDAIPGRVQAFPISSIKTGIFYGQCSELCGVNHAFMPIVVEFVELESFFDWMIKETKCREYKYLLKTVFSELI